MLFRLWIEITMGLFFCESMLFVFSRIVDNKTLHHCSFAFS